MGRCMRALAFIMPLACFCLGLCACQSGSSYDETYTDDLFYEAEALKENSQYDEALKIYAELENSERSEMAYALEGCIYLNRGDLQSANECFLQTLENNDDIEAAIVIYEAYKDINLEADGAKYLEEAISIEPSDAEDYALLGVACDYLGDYDNACTYLNRAINEGYSDAVEILGDIYMREEDYSAARALYNKILSGGENDAAAYNGLAMCYAAEGDYDNALIFIKLGLDCGDSTVQKSLLFNEVVIYEKMFDFETAEEKAEEYTDKYPSDEEMKNELVFLKHE